MEIVRDIPLNFMGALKISDRNGLIGFADSDDVSVDEGNDQLVVVIGEVTLRFDMEAKLFIENQQMVFDDEQGDTMFVTGYCKVTFD